MVALARKLNIRTDFRSVLFEAAALARTRTPVERPFTPSARKPQAPLPAEKINAVLQTLVSACPVAHDSQAKAYLMSRPSGRVLLDEAERAGWGVFPKDSAGVKLAVQVLSKFGLDVLTLADLRMSKTGPVPQHPAYRLLIPFRTPEGLIHTLQRRRLDGRAPKYLFPAGYRALWPYGAEAIGAIGPQTSIVYVEGAIDTLERTGKYRTQGEDRLVLGIPGIATWRGEWAAVCKGREARIALDTDRAGEAAVPRLVADLWQAGATAVHRTRPTDGRKDWNTATRNDLPTPSRP